MRSVDEQATPTAPGVVEVLVAVVIFGAGYKNVVSLTVLLLILTIFPTGLFGKRTNGH